MRGASTRDVRSMIIALCGKRKAGKNEVAKAIRSLYPSFSELSFADSLKREYAVRHNIHPDMLLDPIEKEKHRKGLQVLSEEMKAKHGEDVFARYTLSEIKEGEDVIITDLRFYVELRALDPEVTRIIKVYSDIRFRESRGWEFSEVDLHASENEVANILVCDMPEFRARTVFNNFTNTELLKAEVAKVMVSLCAGL